MASEQDASARNTAAGAAQPSSAGAGPSGGKAAAALLARDLVRTAWKATLATVSRTGGTPYGSLVAMAALPDGAPLLLLSGLAEHTRNLLADRRGSVLVDGTAAGPAALTGARVTLVGRIAEATGDTARRRYLARHPDAEAFIDFGDFGLYALQVEWAHLVAGFGRIVRLDAADMVLPTDDAAALIEAEPGVLQHMNDDHADAIAQIARQALAAQPGGANQGGAVATAGWRMVGCDPAGIDLAAGGHALRLGFPHRTTTPDEVRQALAAMARAARASTTGAASNP